MIKQVFTSARLPEYHKGMLIVKVRPTAGPVMAAVAATRVRGAMRGITPTDASMSDDGTFTTPGLSALSVFERGGLIKRVTPLSRQADEATPAMAPRRAMSALALSAGTTRGRRQDSNTGVSLVELERDADVAGLQIALANDPHVEFVSRVPVRYLVVTRKTAAAKPARAGSKKATITAAPPLVSMMWNLRKIEWAKARSLPGFKEATNIKVAFCCHTRHSLAHRLGRTRLFLPAHFSGLTRR